uniref:Olfactory receptor n=1 Tax=Varanus komodoensis TaxID=61221 RepID=A0A8D2J577_VARKO
MITFPLHYTAWQNQTTVSEFILLGFGDFPKVQVLLFMLFLVIYLVTMAGNLLILVVVVADQHLHTPMYFFLANLSFLESCYSSTILPKMLRMPDHRLKSSQYSLAGYSNCPNVILWPGVMI